MRPVHERRFKWRLLLHLSAIVVLAGLSAAAFAQLPSAPEQGAGSVSGTILDADGELVSAAHVIITAESGSHSQTVTDGQGRFTFAAVSAGKFTLAIAADGLAADESSGVLHAGETVEVPPITLRVATATTDVEVNLSQADIAEAEIKDQEKQRFLGFAPNFYVSYTWDAAPLTKKQKFELADHTVVDPINILISAGIAGVQQANNTFSGYKQGAKGYAKRFGANYADLAIGTYLGGAVYPMIFHQDPRYFYKGVGSIRSRTLYALSTAVIARGDNGKWQPAYAGIAGDMSAGAISNLYYPASNRNGAALTVENGLLAIGFDGLGNVLQEFLWRKLSTGTPKTPKSKP
jgi:hypothetical protein